MLWRLTSYSFFLFCFVCFPCAGRAIRYSRHVFRVQLIRSRKLFLFSTNSGLCEVKMSNHLWDCLLWKDIWNSVCVCVKCVCVRNRIMMFWTRYEINKERKKDHFISPLTFFFFITDKWNQKDIVTQNYLAARKE